MSSPRGLPPNYMKEPGRQPEHRQLLERIQTLEDMLGYIFDKHNELRIRVKALEGGKVPEAPD